LETKVKVMNSLREELEEVRLRNEALESEKIAWTSYLESQSSADAEMRFDSPEELARAFMRERLEKASLMERLGAIQPELAVKDDNIRTLEDEKAQLNATIENLKKSQPTSTNSGDFKAKARLERQKNLAVKETEYLRAQLKALDAEEGEMNPDRYQTTQASRISELETLIDEYRSEISTLNSTLSTLETSNQPSTSALMLGSKRPRDSTSQEDERVGELLRKQRTLQDSLTESKTRITVLESELKAKSAQVSSLRSSSRVRILELKDNPTSTAAAIKQSHLDALQSENDVLRAQLAKKLPTAISKDGTDESKLVPKASLSRMELLLADKDTTIASRDKSLVRLKEIFRAKGLEFREAVFSLLGWQLTFLPNGKVKATSMFYPSSSTSSKRRTRSGKTPAAGTDEDALEHFIEFDGENGTMKVSGGPQSEFAKEIRSLIEFWVDGKGQVPCFLAAMTLEFYDKYGDVVGDGGI
jgi:mitotic spindle assembly checkpoint protein MAD1